MSVTPKGVFVTGTDTEIGKTLVSAILTKAWNATYWKPFQTGLAEETGDTSTVTRLADVAPNHVVAPLCALQAPLSPFAAAELENTVIDVEKLQMPAGNGPFVVEGAGGLMVPVTPDSMMIDVVQRLDLPVVLVARSGLGTINHTLLSLEALRRRDIAIAGVVLSGLPNVKNARDIARFGKTQILFQVPRFENVTPQTIADFARSIPDFAKFFDDKPSQ